MSDYAVNGKEPVAAWIPSLDSSGSGTTTLTDLVGSNDGTLTNMDAGSDWVTDTGAGGVRALDFDGTNDYVHIPDASAIDLVDNITISAWVYFDNVANQLITAKGRDNFPEHGWLMHLLADGTTRFFVGRLLGLAVTGTILSAGTWYHLVGTYNNDRCRIYIDGTLQGTSASSPNELSASNNSPLNFGIREVGVDTAYLDGRLDDIRLFDTALAQADVDFLYGSGTGRGRVAGGIFDPLRGLLDPLGRGLLA